MKIGHETKLVYKNMLPGRVIVGLYLLSKLSLNGKFDTNYHLLISLQME